MVRLNQFNVFFYGNEPLKAAVMAATGALFTSICVGIATLILVPEPSSITFKLVFPWFSLLFAAIALNIVGVWS